MNAETQTLEALPKLTQQLHGYCPHNMPDQLQKRYPYTPSKSNAKPRVYRSYDDRLIESIKEKISNPESEKATLIEGFLVLNEKSNTQEVKVEMISSDIVELCFCMLSTKEHDLNYEILRLLGSLFSVRMGRERLKPEFYMKFYPIIKNGDNRLKKVSAWLLCRISSGRDGADYLIQNNYVNMICDIIMNNQDKKWFIEQLLTTLIELLQFDTAILDFCSLNTFDVFLDILKKFQPTDDEQELRVISKLINCISCICMNEVGRRMLIEKNAIESLEKFLYINHDELINNCLRTLMFVSLERKGKNQLLSYQNGVIIKTIIDLLGKFFEIRENSCEILINLSDNFDAFIFIIENMIVKSGELIRIFGNNAIKPLSILLKKCTSSNYNDNMNQKTKITQILCIFFKLIERNKPATLDYIINNTLDLIRYLLRCVLVDIGGIDIKTIDLIVTLCGCNTKQIALLKSEHRLISSGATFISAEVYNRIVLNNQNLNNLMLL